MELEEAIENIKIDVATPLACGECTICNIEDLETLLNHLKQKEHELNSQRNYCKMIEEQKDDIIKTMAERMTKQEKMIDLMGEKVSHLVFVDDKNKLCMFANKEEVKQYFEKKVEEIS